MMHRLAEYYCMEHEVEEGQWGADQGMDVSSHPVLLVGPSHHRVECLLTHFGCVHTGS
jgi:hypothetical protein